MRYFLTIADFHVRRKVLLSVTGSAKRGSFTGFADKLPSSFNLAFKDVTAI